jgi:hypothetical protein
MCTRRMRHDALQLARRHGCAFAVLYFPTTAAIATQRNAHRAAATAAAAPATGAVTARVATSAAVPDGVIERMAEVLEPPDGERVRWERHCAVIADAMDDAQLDAGVHTLHCIHHRVYLD